MPVEVTEELWEWLRVESAGERDAMASVVDLERRERGADPLRPPREA